MTDEEYVRSKWERILVCDGSYRSYAKGTILLNWANNRFHEFNNFAAAAAFTRDHEEAMRQTASHMYVLRQLAGVQLADVEWAESWGSLRSDLARRYVQLMMVAGKLEAELETMREGMK